MIFVTFTYGVIFLFVMVLNLLVNRFEKKFLPGMYHVFNYSYAYFECIRLHLTYEPVHEISNYVACATSKASDQPAHTRSLIRALASRLNIQ